MEGTARGAADIAHEAALSPYFPVGHRDSNAVGNPVPQVLVDETEGQLDGLVRLLDSMGICVQRPDFISHSVPVKTPDGSVPGGHANACPRDLLLVIGDEIIEAPMAQRARYFEFRPYRKLLKEYFRSGARWTTAPKPLMRISYRIR